MAMKLDTCSQIRHCLLSWVQLTFRVRAACTNSQFSKPQRKANNNNLYSLVRHWAATTIHDGWKNGRSMSQAAARPDNLTIQFIKSPIQGNSNYVILDTIGHGWKCGS